MDDFAALLQTFFFKSWITVAHLDAVERCYSHVEEHAIQHRHGDELMEREREREPIFIVSIAKAPYITLLESGVTRMYVFTCLTLGCPLSRLDYQKV